MNTTSDNLEQAQNAGATAMEHFIKFIYYSVIAIGLVIKTIYLWSKGSYQEKVSSQKMQAETCTQQ